MTDIPKDIRDLKTQTGYVPQEVLLKDDPEFTFKKRQWDNYNNKEYYNEYWRRLNKEHNDKYGFPVKDENGKYDPRLGFWESRWHKFQDKERTEAFWGQFKNPKPSPLPDLNIAGFFRERWEKFNDPEIRKKQWDKLTHSGEYARDKKNIDAKDSSDKSWVQTLKDVDFKKKKDLPLINERPNINVSDNSGQSGHMYKQNVGFIDSY